MTAVVIGAATGVLAYVAGTWFLDWRANRRREAQRWIDRAAGGRL